MAAGIRAGFMNGIYIFFCPVLSVQMSILNAWLNNAFGIGVIRLDAEHFMQSEILFSAKEKDSLDWDTINRLAEDNRNFKCFLNDLMEDSKVGKVKSRYDRVYEDEETAGRELREKGIIE